MSVSPPTIYDYSAGRLARARATWRLMRRRAAEGHQGALRQLGEMAVLWVRSGLRPPYYLKAALYRRELSWRQKREHVSTRDYHRLITRVNPPTYHYITNNKVVTCGLLAVFDIPMPPLYGVVHPHLGLATDGSPLCGAGELENLLVRIGAARVVFKPVSGSRGRGFIKATLHRSGLRVEPGGDRLTVAELWDRFLSDTHGDGYLCQGFVEQHPEAARFNPASLNTVRAWMAQMHPGRWEMYNAVMRIGVGDVPTDNLHTGGIGPRVDVGSGTLRPAIVRHPDRPVYTHHPTTGVSLDGTAVPLWSEVQALCQRTCALFPFLRIMAVDIALSVDGPLVTEVESTPDEHQVGFDRGHGPLLRYFLDRS
jgi:hypothetical protein